MNFHFQSVSFNWSECCLFYRRSGHVYSYITPEMLSFGTRSLIDVKNETFLLWRMTLNLTFSPFWTAFGAYSCIVGQSILLSYRYMVASCIIFPLLSPDALKRRSTDDKTIAFFIFQILKIKMRIFCWPIYCSSMRYQMALAYLFAYYTHFSCAPTCR